MEHLANVGFLVLGLLGGVFALIGIIDAVRQTPITTVRGLGDEDPPAVGDSLFTETMELMSRTSLQPGHHVEVLTCGDETYPALWEA